MAEADNRKLERRLQQLIEEQDKGPSSLAAETSKPTQTRAAQSKREKTTSAPTKAARGLRSNLGMPLTIALSLLIGLQLGALPWRYRREMLQLQGALVGLAIGLAAGRLTARRRG